MGEVAVWDYEMSSLLGYCLGHKNGFDITAIEFLSPYPVMITAALDGKIIFWTVRPVPALNSYICIHQFMNKSFNHVEDVQCAVRSLKVYKTSDIHIARAKPLREHLMGQTRYRKFQDNQILS